jgi:hypothetical protein
MNSNVYMIARPVKWNVLEDFYKGVEGGLDKLTKMKELCKFRAEEYFGEPRLREAEVNKEFLFDRQQKLNAEFTWTEENIGKLVRLDQHIRKIEYDAMYIDDKEHERKKDWVSGLLQDYTNWGLLDWFTFGDGDEPDDALLVSPVGYSRMEPLFV